MLTEGRHHLESWGEQVSKEIENGKVRATEAQLQKQTCPKICHIQTSLP